VIRTIPRPAGRGDPHRITEVDREDFLGRFWRYQAGQHTTFLAPTDCGKTTLCFQLLQRTWQLERIPTVFYATKPRDDLVADWADGLGYKTIRDWPPPATGRLWRALFNQPVPGWVLWPRHDGDPDIDDAHHHEVFRRAMLATYRDGARRKRARWITVSDEAGSLANDLALRKIQTTVLKKARACKCGSWNGDQRPANLPYECYNCAEHVFIHHDPDKRTRERYDEIGGFDGNVVRDVVRTLEKWSYLYLRRSDRSMCIIGP
jgi:hypothetical protein